MIILATLVAMTGLVVGQFGGFGGFGTSSPTPAPKMPEWNPDEPLCDHIYMSHLPADLAKYRGTYERKTDADGNTLTLNNAVYYTHVSTGTLIYFDYMEGQWVLGTLSGSNQVYLFNLEKDVTDPASLSQPWARVTEREFEELPDIRLECVDCNFDHSKLEAARQKKREEAMNALKSFEVPEVQECVGHCHNGKPAEHGAHDRRLMAMEDFTNGIPPDAWEYAGTFLVEDDIYTWTIQRQEGCYHAPATRMLVMETDGNCDKTSYGAVLESARAMWVQHDITDISHGETVSMESVHGLVNNQQSGRTVFHMALKRGCVVVMTEHDPSVLGTAFPALRSKQGDFITPTWDTVEEALLEEEGEAIDKWEVFPEALFAVAVCTAPTLLGVFMLIPCFKKFQMIVPALNAFAGGVLVGASLLHLYPEGMAMVDLTGNDLMLQSGIAVMIGCFVGFFLDLAFPHEAHSTENLPDEQVDVALEMDEVDNMEEGANPSVQKGDEVATSDVKLVAQGEKDMTEEEKESLRIQKAEALARAQGKLVFPKHAFCDLSPVSSVAWNLCLGDACHNITDGVMIGAAFASCNSEMGWIITGAMLAHELPQEIGDFFLLINAGMSMSQALFWNVISGLTAVAGLIVVFVANINSTHLGLLLMGGAGVFIYISLADLVPDIVNQENTKRKWVQVTFYLLGLVVVGLTIGAHTHCEAAEGSPMATLHGHAHR